jgi:phosphoribosylglycinamide formyltransferase-1
MPTDRDLKSNPLRIAALISGGGTTMVNLHERITAGTLDARIVAAIASNTKAGGIEKANALGLPMQVIARKTFADTAAFSAAVFDHLRTADTELVVLAGFLSLLAIPDDFTGKVMNIHPALLPKFGGQGMYGHHVHEAVLAAGESQSGCTVHFADNEYDHGPIILQRACPVQPRDTPDTLAQRVMEQEREAYPQAVQMYAEGQVRYVDGRAVFE